MGRISGYDGLCIGGSEDGKMHQSSTPDPWKSSKDTYWFLTRGIWVPENWSYQDTLYHLVQLGYFVDLGVVEYKKP